MKVNHTIFMGDDTLRARHGYEDGQKDSDRRTIFAGGLKKVIDPIQQKREQAQKQAMKIIGDTWANDQKIDNDLDNRREKVREYQKEIGAANDELLEIKNNRAKLREDMGIAEDSQEEQDLKLLEKEIDSRKAGSDIHLTKEEQERIAQIKANGLTEYQERSLAMKSGGALYEKEIEEASQKMQGENAAIKSTELERLKKDLMVGAQKAADEILEQASDQIVGMLMEEAKDHIDEEMEEKKEAAEKAEEKKEEEEERVEKQDEKKEQEEQFREQIKDSTELMTKSDELLEDVQKEVKKILDEMKLLEEDLKGASVDTAG